MRATLNESYPLRVFLPEGRGDLAISADVKNAATQLTAAFLVLQHVGGGLYQANWTPDACGHYTVIYDLNNPLYDKESEVIEVTSEKTDIARLLGLNSENTVLDLTEYNSAGKLVSARMRTYDTKTHADAALAASPDDYNTGLIFSWNISASWDSNNKPETLLIGRVQ